MQLETSFLASTFSKVRGLKNITFNTVSHDLVWQYKKNKDDMSFVQAIFLKNLINTRRSVLIDKHLLILDRHGSHVILEAIEQAYEVRLNMITLPSHILHALQPSDVRCFKPFKFAFRKERYESMFRNNHREPNKVTLASWVDRAFD